MQIKATVYYQYTLISMAKNKLTILDLKKELSFAASGNAKQYCHSGKTV